MSTPRLSITEFVVLGVVGEGPTHGFAISKELVPSSELGRVFTVRRPLVYRALDRLVETGYVASVSTEKGDAGPERTIHRITSSGRRRLNRWLAEPVDHVRDLRIEFLLKITLIERSNRSPLQLIQDQRAALRTTLEALDKLDTGRTDHIGLWRRHNAAAAVAYLEELERRCGAPATER